MATLTKEKTAVPAALKTYEFELVASHAEYKPVDRNNANSRMGGDYPPLYSIPNSGIALDEKGNPRSWRLIQGQTSIWNDEQKGLLEMTKRQIDSMLARPENKLEFKNGKLLVPGVEKLKLKALELSDTYEGIKTPYREKQPVFRLNNPDEMVNNSLDKQATEFKALQLAHGATTEEMLAYAYALGINTDDQTQSGLNRVKTSFIAKAKEKPEVFVEMFGNPSNKVKFTIKDALSKNIISYTQIPNSLTWTQHGTEIIQVNSNGDVIAEVASKVLAKDKEATKMYETLQTVLAE